MLDLRSLLEQPASSFTVGAFQAPYGALVADDGSGLLYDETEAFVLYDEDGSLPVALTMSERFMATVAVAQAAATLTGTVREDFVLSAIAISQAAATVSATTRERFLTSIVATQPAASVTATVAEHFRLSVASTQAAASLAAVTAERFVLSTASTQAAAAVAATARERFIASTAATQGPAAIAASLTSLAVGRSLSVVVAQAPASIAAVLGGGTEIALSGGGHPTINTLRAAPVRRRAPAVLAATVAQAAPRLSLVMSTNDDSNVLELLELLAA